MSSRCLLCRLPYNHISSHHKHLISNLHRGFQHTPKSKEEHAQARAKAIAHDLKIVSNAGRVGMHVARTVKNSTTQRRGHHIPWLLVTKNNAVKGSKKYVFDCLEKDVLETADLPRVLEAYSYMPRDAEIAQYFERPYGETLSRRDKLLRVLATSKSVEDAWRAYHALVSALPHQESNFSKAPIPYSHLHHLARLLASTKPRTRALFLRLSSVLNTLRKSGGNVQLWEWNALIDCAGKGWRKLGLDDYKAALNVFNSMISNHRRDDQDAEDATSDDTFTSSHPDPILPDVVTYTTLLDIAGRTKHPTALRHATSLLKSSGLPANRITHLSLLRYYARTKQLPGIRSTVLKMRNQNLPLGLDGINACLWAFACNGHLDVASNIYRVLRHNVIPDTATDVDSVEAVITYLAKVEGIVVPNDVRPNEITYTAMIQAFAYHGNLIRALEVFIDLLSTPNVERKFRSDEKNKFVLYEPSLAAFRGIFVGFVRHVRPPQVCLPGLTGRLYGMSHPALYPVLSSSEWNLDNLHVIFEAFLDLPPDVQPGERVLYWILIAFGKASEHDAGELRKIYLQLERRFGGGWGGRLGKLRTFIFAQGGGGQKQNR